MCSGARYLLGLALLGAISATPFATAAELDADPRPGVPHLLSAFFGLDNGLSARVNAICPGAAGEDGMPVVFSHTVAVDTLEPADFRVTTQSGASHVPRCVTVWPARDPGENRTVLLIGELGDATRDPPISVAIVDDLDADMADVQFRGATVAVTPLAEGPSLVLAEPVPTNAWRSERGCPATTKQVIRVTWAGGVRLPSRDELGDTERQLYRVRVEGPTGARRDVSPIALGDLDDRDNNHLLCLDTDDPAQSIHFPAGHLTDPNRDLNPATTVAVTAGYAR